MNQFLLMSCKSSTHDSVLCDLLYTCFSSGRESFRVDDEEITTDGYSLNHVKQILTCMEVQKHWVSNH